MKKAVLISLAVLCMAAVGLKLSKTSAKQGVPVVPFSYGSPPLAQDGVPGYSAAIAQSLNSIRLVAPPIIDGHPSDWPFGNTIELNRATAYLFGGKIDGLADLSAVIRSGWDDEKLYFLIEVTDDKIVADSSDVWRDDGVEIGLDGLHDQYPWGWDDHQYCVVVDGRKTDRVTPITNIAAAVLQVQGGYNIEVAIPVSQLIPGTPVSGTVMGFTVGIHDDDDGGNYDAYLIWQGKNTSSSPEEFGSLIFMERSEDRLIALEARIAKLEDRIRELLVVMGEFGPLTLPTLSAPSETPIPTVTPVAPTLVQTATPSHTPTLGPSSTPTPTTSGPSRTPTLTTTPASAGTETTVTLQQGLSGYLGCDDTYIYQYAPNGNYCTQDLIMVGSNQQYRGLVRFDVSAIPRNAVVTRAALQIYMAGWGGLDTTVGVSFILRTVTACEATWNQAQNGNPWSQSGCNSTTTDRRSVTESTVRTDGVGKWSEFALSAAVQSWVDGSLPNNGVLLSATNADLANLLFASAQTSDINFRPKLVVTYHVPSGALSADPVAWDERGNYL